jgi:hypothetical protein
VNVCECVAEGLRVALSDTVVVLRGDSETDSVRSELRVSDASGDKLSVYVNVYVYVRLSVGGRVRLMVGKRVNVIVLDTVRDAVFEIDAVRSAENDIDADNRPVPLRDFVGVRWDELSVAVRVTDSVAELDRLNDFVNVVVLVSVLLRLRVRDIVRVSVLLAEAVSTFVALGDGFDWDNDIVRVEVRDAVGVFSVDGDRPDRVKVKVPVMLSVSVGFAEFVSVPDSVPDVDRDVVNVALRVKLSVGADRE